MKKMMSKKRKMKQQILKASQSFKVRKLLVKVVSKMLIYMKKQTLVQDQVYNI